VTRPLKVSEINPPDSAAQPVARRDILVLGGSAGSYPALRTIISSLDENFHAAVFVVLHTHPRANPGLDRSLGSAAVLPTTYAADGMPIQPGNIYLAPPDRHLILARDHIHVTRSPKEGLHRPSINVTFRSAAQRYGRRVIGVLLSGMLDDGASGMWEIAKYGGVTIVQSTAEAQFDSMPLSALKDAPINYELPAAEIASLLPHIVGDCETSSVISASMIRIMGSLAASPVPNAADLYMSTLTARCNFVAVSDILFRFRRFLMRLPPPRSANCTKQLLPLKKARTWRTMLPPGSKTAPACGRKWLN